MRLKAIALALAIATPSVAEQISVDDRRPADLYRLTCTFDPKTYAIPKPCTLYFLSDTDPETYFIAFDGVTAAVTQQNTQPNVQVTPVSITLGIIMETPPRLIWRLVVSRFDGVARELFWLVDDNREWRQSDPAYFVRTGKCKIEKRIL